MRHYLIPSWAFFKFLFVSYIILQPHSKDILLFLRVSSFLFLKCWWFLFMNMCVIEYQVCADTHGGQKRALDLLKLKLQAIVNCSLWVLASELWSSGEQPTFLIHDIFPALKGILSWETVSYQAEEAGCHLWELSWISFLSLSPQSPHFSLGSISYVQLAPNKKAIGSDISFNNTQEMTFLPQNDLRKQWYKVWTELL